MGTSKNGKVDTMEFISSLNLMGWVRIVGRRLFKIIDQQQKGEIELSDLEAVFGRYVAGQPDEHEVMQSLQRADEEAKAAEKDQLGEARERIRQLTIENTDLETENRRLKTLS